MKVWGEAKRLARETLSRWSARESEIDDDYRLREYLKSIVDGIRKRRWSIDAQPPSCALCGNKKNRLRTGVIPTYGAILYCTKCADTYHILRNEIDIENERNKVHLNQDGASRCGIGTVLVSDPDKVTCLRCKMYIKTSSILVRLLR